MWTTVETPTLKQLLSFSLNPNFPLEKRYRKNSRNIVFWTSRTLQSLNEICLWFKKEHGRSPIISAPAYICYEVPEVFLINNAEIQYYDIDDNFNVDLSSLGDKCDLFLAVHYFGIASDLSRVKKYCTKTKAILIEDATHVPFPVENIGNYGDICLYSPYKHFPVPDGACAVFKGSLLDSYPELKKRFERLQSHFSLPVKWMLKKSVQTVFRINRANPLKDFLVDPTKGNIQIADSGISEYTLNILSHYSEEDLDKILKRRKENIILWHQILSFMDINHTRSPSAEIPMNYILQDISLNSERFSLFNSLGVFPSTWPTLPDTENAYSNRAKQIRKSIILLPVHQGIKAKDFLTLLYYVEKQAEKSVKLDPFKGTGLEWDELLSKTFAPNILNSDSFIKSRSKNLQRYVLKIESKFSGVAVIRKKKIGPFVLNFVNRGPLLVTDNPVFHLKSIKALNEKHRYLLISPEIEDNPVIQYYFKKSHLLRLPIPQHHSSKIDLENDLAQLRAKLDSKWRNLLKKGESLNPEIVFSSEKKDYETFLKMYKNFVSEKKFQGLSFELLERYFDCCEIQTRPYVLFIKKEEQIISAVLIARYANEGLYLAGINDEEGRKTCGNYVLLWKAVELLKNQGYKTVDLGGFDDINTPQITHFKRQMGGTEFKLAGTYLVLK